VLIELHKNNMSGISSVLKPTTKTIKPLRAPIGLLGRDNGLRKSGSQANMDNAEGLSPLTVGGKVGDKSYWP
jgi:hypothetical protein